jgi:hypothetical protein
MDVLPRRAKGVRTKDEVIQKWLTMDAFNAREVAPEIFAVSSNQAANRNRRQPARRNRWMVSGK